MALAEFNLIDNKFGRKVIYSPVVKINRNNIVDVLQKAVLVHEQNRAQIEYLEKYYTGNQPILYREKAIRPEINNILVENHAYEIVEFMVGQDCGEPIQYVRRGTDEAKSNDVQKLNDYMASENKSYWDSELSRWRHMVGTSYKICYPDKMADIVMDECPFGIDVLDPKDTFVVYSSGLGKLPLMGVYRTVNEKDEVEYHCYTNTEYFKIVNDIVVQEDINGVGMILIVEYPNNSRRIGEIELVIGLLDAINKIQSNRLDGIEQFIQALMVFENCQIDSEKFKELREQGAITVISEDGRTSRVYSINDQLDQTQTQVLIDDLYDKVLTILGMPSREQNTGGDTGSAVYLRNGWDFAEKRAENSEKPFEKAEKDFLKIALKILTTNDLLDLKLSDIDIKITRSKSDNMVVKTQALLQQLQSGVNPQIALKTCELYPDPEDVYVRSKEVMDARYGVGSLIKGQITDKDGNVINSPPNQTTKPQKEAV